MTSQCVVVRNCESLQLCKVREGESKGMHANFLLPWSFFVCLEVYLGKSASVFFVCSHVCLCLLSVCPCITRSPGFGLSLVAETTNGTFLSAELASNPQGQGSAVLPEDLGRNCAKLLLEEIYRVCPLALQVQRKEVRKDDRCLSFFTSFSALKLTYVCVSSSLELTSLMGSLN